MLLPRAWLCRAEHPGEAMKVARTGTEVGMGCSRKVMTGWVSAADTRWDSERQRGSQNRGRETETHRGESCGQKEAAGDCVGELLTGRAMGPAQRVLSSGGKAEGQRVRASWLSRLVGCSHWFPSSFSRATPTAAFSHCSPKPRGHLLFPVPTRPRTPLPPCLQPSTHSSHMASLSSPQNPSRALCRPQQQPVPETPFLVRVWHWALNGRVAEEGAAG